MITDNRVPFDLTDPPEEPPPGVAATITWRLAVRLYRDHEAAEGSGRGGAGPSARARCRLCANLWPCGSRRLALVGLRAAAGSGAGPRGDLCSAA